VGCEKIEKKPGGSTRVVAVIRQTAFETNGKRKNSQSSFLKTESFVKI
jgi:hypothetical protein